ncbi:hypothetical protein [Legionella sp. WA2022007384]
MKYTFLSICLLAGASNSVSAGVLPSAKDAQLCTNAYNKLWHVFDSVKAQYRGDPEAQAVVFNQEFPNLLSQDFSLTINNLPIEPNSTETVTVTAQGLPQVVVAASEQITSWGQHHIAGPFSFKLISESASLKTRVYLMTTRDIDYTNSPGNSGCAAFLAQKNMVCTVKNTMHSTRRAMLNSMNSHVVTTYVMPSPNCSLWIAPPIEDFPTEA